MTIKTIGFIGTGVMGKSMIRHLLKKYNVVVYNRTKERALDLLEEGATWADTPTEVANLADVVLTIVGYPKDVEEVYFGDQGIFKSTKEHLVVVDLTTSTPTLAKRIRRGPWCEKRNALYDGWWDRRNIRKSISSIRLLL